MQARISTCAGLALLATLVACGRGSEATRPTWIELGRGFEPRPLLDTARGWPAAEGDASVHLRADDTTGGVWVERVIPAADWTAEELPGLWSVPLPHEGLFRFAQGPLRLSTGETVFVRALETDEPGPDRFVVSTGKVRLFLGAGTPPPAETVLAIEVRNGMVDDGNWRIRTGDHVGTGIPVWVGSEEVVDVDVPAGSQLRFKTYYSPTLPELADAEPRATFEIRLDDTTLFSREVGAGLATESVPLPPAGKPDARLTFRVRGAPGLGVFFDPVLGPAETGDYGARPWGAGRPNIVLFLADTFRADNLSAYGGPPDLAPHLDRFAESSLRFLHTRSVASWTLPALGTLFTGRLPGQHGATDIGLALPRDLDTIAELLARHGYRTAAITDSGFFTIAFGLDQGFAWFEENQNASWDLDHTLDEAVRFLDHDDGRPIFLVVHTYRTHAPYRRGAGEDAADWDQLTAEAAAMLAERRAQGATGDLKREVLLAFQERLANLYRAGVQDLDDGFGRFLGELERRRVLEHGFLVFTSDHGEALGENDEVLHGGRLREVKLRIPLLVHGSGLAPADVEWSASLADLPATLATLAGVRVPADWGGTSLLSLAAERPQLAFQLEKNHREVAAHDRDRKLLTAPDVERWRAGDVDAAYDLAQDPGEATNLCAEPWAAELARQLATLVEAALEPATDPARVDTAPEALRDLQKIGYDGDG